MAIREGSASGTAHGRERAAYAASNLANTLWQTGKIEKAKKSDRIAIMEGNASATPLGKYIAANCSLELERNSNEDPNEPYCMGGFAPI
jgi:hypothetical protein